MNPKYAAILAGVVAALSCGTSQASTAYGDLNNFDVVNDTGVPCHGFEIELDDVHSRDITYTYDWNHYGTPRITEDNSDPVHPRVFIRYASARNPDGSWAAHTAVPPRPLAPTDGHMFTDPSVNEGGEHFGVGYYGSPSAVKYNWLVDDGAGTLIHGPSVTISTPTFVYYPPVPAPVFPADPPAAPAQVQAVIIPIVPEEPQLLEFGPATWVKEIRTVTHNAGRVELRDLVSDDPNVAGEKNWKNGEPDEVEVEWQLLQTEFSKVGGGANGELAGAPEDLPGGDEVVTRRYEFFKYTGPMDPESGEALADRVAPDDLHGVGVKTSGGVDYDLASLEVVGAYIGAQMAGFAVAAPLGLIDHLQDGEIDVPYVERTVVVGGNYPYLASLDSGALPPGMILDPINGVISGTPTAGGLFSFTVSAQDADSIVVSQAYTLLVTVPLVPTFAPVISSLSAGAISETGATLTWTTDQASTSQAQVDGILTPLDLALVTQHSVVLSGLAPATSYSFVVMSANASGDAASSPESVLVTATPPPPVISGVGVSNVGLTEATLTWTTDQPSSTQASVDGILTPLDPALVIQHSVALAGLAPATTYHFVVESVNASGSSATSADATFATTIPASPVISSVSVVNITQTGATLVWTTDQPSTSQAAVNGIQTSLDPALVTQHRVPVTGLVPGTIYRFVVTSLNSTGGASTSPEAIFSTATAPVADPCRRPAGAREAEGKGRIKEMGDGYVVIGNRRINLPSCARIQLHGARKLAPGQKVEWEGYRIGGVVTATEISID